MKLGILVNTDKNPVEIVGLAGAALSQGHEVNIFIMDDGVRLLNNAALTGLCGVKGVRMSFCDYSTQQLGGKPAELPEQIICGSQYDNAVMAHESDKVIVL